jgi:AcrR family transcriptional regulator
MVWKATRGSSPGRAALEGAAEEGTAQEGTTLEGAVQEETTPDGAPGQDAAVDGKVAPTLGRPDGGASAIRPSLGGGTPAQERELGRQGRQTVRKLLEAGLAEFDERGFQAVRVDDVVRRAKTSHGTFYLYFASKDDLFKTLLRDALHDMEIITGDFPVVTRNEPGREALRAWVSKFCDTYGAHASVIRILSTADVVSEEVYGEGLQLFFRIAEAITQGMTAASAAKRTPDQESSVPEHAELTAVACLMMLERVNYLFSVDVGLPRDEMVDRISAIIYAAFHSA